MIVFDSPRLTDICRCLPGKTGPLYCDRPIADPGEFQKRFSLPALPYLMQQAVLQIAQDTISPGLMIVEAQMGIGKTEAALAAAEQFLQKTGAGGCVVQETVFPGAAHAPSDGGQRRASAAMADGQGGNHHPPGL